MTVSDSFEKKSKENESESSEKDFGTNDESGKSPSTSALSQQQIDGPYSASQINASMTTKEAYFELLRTWINQANMSQSAMACFPYYLMTNYPQLFQQQGQQSATPTSIGHINGGRNLNIFGQNIAGGFAAAGFGRLGGVGNFGGVNGLRGNDRRFGDYFDNETRQAQEELINQNGGYEFVIAPFWKRLAAEIVDSIILLLLKLVLTFAIVDLFDLNLYVPKTNDPNSKQYAIIVF